MLGFIIALLALIAIFAIKWGLAPYFAWKRLSEKPFNDTITVVTKDGRESLSDYMRNRQRDLNKVDYTVLVPAYNEAKRLPNMLPKTVAHFESMGHKYEIIVVSDASKDKTTEVALSFADYNGKRVNIKVLEYNLNQGKGGAVRTGFIAASGDFILMADADGASEIKEFDKVLKRLKEIETDGHGIAAGSRNVVDEHIVSERLSSRLFLSKVSNFIIQKICGVRMKDTQCGFKLFTAKSGKAIFKALHIRRWAFDVELFVVANEMNIPYVEVPISYCDQDDSKLNVVTDSMQMARDFLLIKLFYTLRLWRKNDTDKIWEAFLPSTNPPASGSQSPTRSPKRPKRE